MSILNWPLKSTVQTGTLPRIGLVHGSERLAGVARLARTPTLLRDQIVTLENAIDSPTSWCLAELLGCEFADLDPYR